MVFVVSQAMRIILFAARIQGKAVMVTGRRGCIPKSFEWEQPASTGMTVANGTVGDGEWGLLQQRKPRWLPVI